MNMASKENILLGSTNIIKERESYPHKTLEERATQFGGELHLEAEYDWGEPVGEEVW